MEKPIRPIDLKKSNLKDFQEIGQLTEEDLNKWRAKESRSNDSYEQIDNDFPKIFFPIAKRTVLYNNYTKGMYTTFKKWDPSVSKEKLVSEFKSKFNNPLLKKTIYVKQVNNNYEIFIIHYLFKSEVDTFYAQNKNEQDAAKLIDFIARLNIRFVFIGYEGYKESDILNSFNNNFFDYLKKYKFVMTQNIFYKSEGQPLYDFEFPTILDKKTSNLNINKRLNTAIPLTNDFGAYYPMDITNFRDLN